MIEATETKGHRSQIARKITKQTGINASKTKPVSIIADLITAAKSLIYISAIQSSAMSPGLPDFLGPTWDGSWRCQGANRVLKC